MALFYDVVILFVLLSVCGWICESVFCSIQERRLVSRGFLSGPVCPIYGAGGLIVIYLLRPFSHNIVLLFLAGMIATTLLEYVTSFGLEKLFHTSWWDYSDMRLNINGRVCLQFSLIFGGLSVVAQRLLAPPFLALMAWIPAAVKPWAAWGLLLVLGLDIGVTVHSILQLNGKLEQLKQAAAEFKARLEHLQGENLNLSQRLERWASDQDARREEWRESLESFLRRQDALREARQRFQPRRLRRAFPDMKPTKYAEQLHQIRRAIEHWKKTHEKDQERS